MLLVSVNSMASSALQKIVFTPSPKTSSKPSLAKLTTAGSAKLTAILISLSLAC